MASQVIIVSEQIFGIFSLPIDKNEASVTVINADVNFLLAKQDCFVKKRKETSVVLQPDDICWVIFKHGNERLPLIQLLPRYEMHIIIVVRFGIMVAANNKHEKCII